MTTTNRDGERTAERRLPLAGLVALSVTGFLTMLTETVPAGLLPDIGMGLSVDPGLAGQLVTVYAAGSVIAAIPVTALTRSLPRRPLLLATVLVVAAVNGLTALSGSFELTFAARLLAGMAAGVQWAMIAGYAMRMVPEGLKGRALAVSMAGVPLALALGVPIGTFAGTVLGWRWTFAVMALLAVVVAVWAVLAVPPFAGESARDRIPIRGVLVRPGVLAVLAVAFLFEVGHMSLYTYIAPYLALSGLASAIGGVLMVFGVAAVVGLWAVGVLIDRNLRAVVLGSLAAFSACMLVLALLSGNPLVVLGTVAVWGFTLGGAPTMVQAASARAAGPAVDVAQSMLVTMLNAGMSVGALVGGLALGGIGVAGIAWVSLVVFLGALAVAVLARRHGFPPSAAEPATATSGVSARPGEGS